MFSPFIKRRHKRRIKRDRDPFLSWRLLVGGERGLMWLTFHIPTYSLHRVFFPKGGPSPCTQHSCLDVYSLTKTARAPKLEVQTARTTPTPIASRRSRYPRQISGRHPCLRVVVTHGFRHPLLNLCDPCAMTGMGR